MKSAKRKQVIRNNLFMKFFLSYLVIFVVPFCAILITYLSASSTLKNTLISSSKNSLYQFFYVLDMQFSKMMEVNYNINCNSSFQSFSHLSASELEKPTITTYDLRKEIFSYSYAQDNYDDILVYFYEPNLVINQMTCLSLSDFYEAKYSTKTDYNNFSSIFTPATAKLTPHLISVNGDTSKALLGITMHYNSAINRNAAPNFMSLVTMKQDDLQQLFQNSNYYSTSTFMIFDSNQQLLASSDGSVMPIDFEKYYDNTDFYYETIDSHKYVIQIFPSKVVDCLYVSATPINSFWEQLNSLRNICLICMLFTIIVSFFGAWLLAKANYSPIAKLVDKITLKADLKYNKDKNELLFIDEALQISLDKITFLNKKINTERDTLRNNFLFQALQGTYSQKSEDREEDDFLHYHIKLLSDTFCVMVFTIEDAGIFKEAVEETTLNTLNFVLANVAEELCAEKHQGFLVNADHMQYACIVNFNSLVSPSQYWIDAKNIAAKCNSFIKNHFNIISSVSLSSQHTGMIGIHSCYKEALKGIEYRYVYGKGSVILYPEISQRFFNYDILASEKIYKILQQYITIGDETKNSMQLLQEICTLCSLNSISSLEANYCFRYDMINLLSKCIHQLNASNLDCVSDYQNILLGTETFEEFSTRYADMLDNLQLFYKETSETHTICDKVQSYIEENFSDPDLNNNILGNIFAISPSYLARMYKLQKGIGLLDYLTIIRIRKIKELLANTNMSIEKIAQEAGFLSSSTLIKTFKKSEGITPGAYRKLKRES